MKLQFISIDHLSKMLLLMSILVVNPWYKYVFNIDVIFVSIFLLSLTLYILKFGLNISKRFILISLLFAIIFVAQFFAFGYLPLITIFGFYIKIFSAYLIIKISKNFLQSFIKIIFVLSSISLVFWFFEALTPLNSFREHFLCLYVNDEAVIPSCFSPIYTSKSEYYIDPLFTRNSGFAWEPSAFSAFNLIALLLLTLIKDSLSIISKGCYIFIFVLSVLTSQSTMGFVTLPVLIYLLMKKNSERKLSINTLKQFFITLPVIVTMIFFIANLDFVTNKIQSQLQSSLENNVLEGATNTRFGSMFFDLFYFYQSPIIGNGLNEVTRYRFNDSELLREGHGNGLTDFLADFGLIAFIIIFRIFFKGISSFRHEDKIFSITALLVLAMILFSGHFFNHLFFWCILFFLMNASYISQQHFKNL
jgi:hypothetical protein